MAAIKKNEYGNESISALKGADRVRKRPAVIFGSDGLEGCQHSVFEILSNAVDEAREGYGNIIHVTAYQDKSIKVDDRGRGVPLGYNEREGRYNWELIYCDLYAGGKYNNNAAASAYKYSLGLNGLGACATQYSSEFMTVQSFDGANMSKIEFSRGNPVCELVVTTLERRGKRTGTIVHWRPDLEVFTDINIPQEYYMEMLRKQSVVNSGTKFIFNWQLPDNKFETHEFFYERGIIDYVTELAGESAMTVPIFWNMETAGRDRADKEEYSLKAEVSFCISNTVNVIEYYHNASFLEHGGSPDKAVRSAFIHEIDKYLKNNNKYLKNESKINFNDVEDCLVLITSSLSTQTSYANQTKKAINNVFITEAMTEFLKHNLEVYFAENPIEAERFTSQVLINKRSREQAESTRLNLKKKLIGNIDIANRVEKFVNCRSKDPSKRELYIVEGNSALTSCKLARDAEFQAIIPVRGKTLNCLKSTYDSMLKKEIIVDLLKVIGCGIEIKTKAKSDMGEFDVDSIRWDKIIICTDADKDGYHIRTLILTMFYRLLPTLIKMGKIYIAESPLYEITAKEKTYFAFNEQERAAILKKLGNTKYTIQRSKGLGENESEMMAQTTMNPSSRRLIKILEADETETYNMFDTMLGDNLPARKEYIKLYGNNYLDKADVYGDD